MEHIRIRKQRNLVETVAAALRMVLTAIAAGFIAYALGSNDYGLIGAGVFGILLALTRSNNNVGGIKDEDFLFLSAIPATAIVAVLAFPTMALMVGQTALLIIGALVALVTGLVVLVASIVIALGALGVVLALVRRFGRWGFTHGAKLVVAIAKFLFVDLIGGLGNFVGGIIGSLLHGASEWMLKPFGFIVRRVFKRDTNWIARLNAK